MILYIFATRILRANSIQKEKNQLALRYRSEHTWYYFTSTRSTFSLSSWRIAVARMKNTSTYKVKEL
jgi:hypothetical protein